MKKITIVIACLIAFACSNAQQKDTTHYTPVDTVVLQANAYTLNQLSSYVQTNFKTLTIQQVEDLMKFMNQVGDVTRKYYNENLEKKKPVKK